MSRQDQDLDGFFLAHTHRRVEAALRSAKCELKSLAGELTALSGREPIPSDLRATYRDTADLLMPLLAELDRIQREILVRFHGAQELRPDAPPLEAPVPEWRSRVLEAARTVELAEDLAHQVLDTLLPSLRVAPWDPGRTHAVATCTLSLEPGGAFAHYRIEDTDFNLVELTTSILVGGMARDPWPPNPSGPLAELDPHGEWLYALERMGLGAARLSLVDEIYVDFNLGVGLRIRR